MLSVDIDVCVYGRRLHECAQVITDFVVNIALFIACSKRARGNKTELVASAATEKLFAIRSCVNERTCAQHFFAGA